MTQAAMDNDTMVAVTPEDVDFANEIIDSFRNMLSTAYIAPASDQHWLAKKIAARHQSGRTGAGEVLREALGDSQSTLSAIKAECIARTEQDEDQMASHIAEICQITMVTNAAALGTRS